MRRKDRAVADSREIAAILSACKVCHLAIPDGGAPYVVPLNFGFTLEHGALTLYFHSAKQGRKLELLSRRPCVGFAVSRELGDVRADEPCRSGCCYESVLGSGTAEILTDTDEKCAALTRLMQHQFGGGEIAFTHAQAEGVCVFRVVSTMFQAKRKV